MKTVVITGVSRGFGLALTQEFLESGYYAIGSVLPGREAPDEIMKSDRFEKGTLDISSVDSINNFVEQINNRPIDILINNAGLYDSKNNTVDDMALVDQSKDMAQIFLVNAIGPRLLAEALLENINSGNKKLVLSITSRMGTFSHMSNEHANHWLYSGSKCALNYIMVAFGRLNQGITSSLVFPGWMSTHMGGSSAPISPKESAQKIVSLIEEGFHFKSNFLYGNEGQIFNEFKNERIG